MNLPITSRLKRVSALKKTRQQDSAIDPDNPSATVGGGTKSPDIITNESVTSEDPKLTSFKERCGKYGGVNSAAAAADGCVWSDDAKDPDPIVTNTQTTTPGEDSTYTGTLKTTTTADVTQPWEDRALNRGTKVANRMVRNSQNKLDKTKRKQKKMMDKYDTDKDGEISDAERSEMSSGFLGFGNKKKKFDKLAAKKTENKNELETFEAAAENNKKTRSSGRKAGTNIVTGSRNTQRSERTPEQQAAQLAAEALAKKKASAGKMKASSPYKMKGSMFQKRY
tara:strand:+ start:14 stop:856 length:843 start_codon:yes stop_codon:yes gene_type:complete